MGSDDKDSKNKKPKDVDDEIVVVDDDEEVTEPDIESNGQPNGRPDAAPASEKSAGTSEVDELRKKHLYLLADFDNYRKQAIKERSDLIKYGNEPIVREFLSVLDNLERAAGTALSQDTMETYKSGVDMILNQFKKTLEKFGVEEIDPKGQIFDPSIHEALGSDKNPDLPPNTVTQVLKKAYKLRGKVIRPAQVLVNT